MVDDLAEHVPDDVGTALAVWGWFEPYGRDPHEEAWATRMVPASCEDEVAALLAAARRHARAPPPRTRSSWARTPR